MMKNFIIYITYFLFIAVTFSVTAQDLSWYELNRIEVSNNNILTGSGSALSLEVLPQEVTTGYFEVTDFKINDTPITTGLGGSHMYDYVSIYLTKSNQGTVENTLSQLLMDQDKYSIHISKSRNIVPSGTLNTNYGYNVIVRNLDGEEIGRKENITPASTDKIRIQKINATKLLFLFNEEEVASVEDAELSWYHVGYSGSIISSSGESTLPKILSCRYNQEGFKITANSYGPFTVTDRGKNWVSTNSYDITGKLVGAGVNYYDKLGKATQSQVFDRKEGKTWASETRYDNQGRPALSTLSAPIGNAPRFSYKNGFIKKGDDTDFTISDFENTTPEDPSEVGEQENTLGWYYSENNTDEDAEGNSYQDITSRPYSRTIFSELNPGTALKTIGGNKVNDNWKQGYTFSMPAGEELTQQIAFGDTKYNPNNYKIIKTVSRDVHGAEAVVFTDADGKTLAAARSGNEAADENFDNAREATVKIGTQGFVDIHIPVGTNGITITGASDTVQVYDLITEQVIDTPVNGLVNGFYRVAVIDLEAYIPESVSVVYPENYYDYSLNYYDDAGRLISSEQPLYTDETEPKKLKSTFEYNALGLLTQTHSHDEGDAWFLYRKDGQIRFSTNSKQWANKEFSYTNYDQLGRPKESGVYKDNTLVYLNAVVAIGDVDKTTDPFKNSLKNILDSVLENGGFPEEDRSEIHKTTYDYLEEDDITALPVGYKNPSFLSGNVAKTWNAQTTTYYSYDIYGRVQWIVQNINGLGTKTIDYEYDPITSQVHQVVYQKDKSDQFIHRYTYDKNDYSLVMVETSLDGTNYTEQAKYAYYETGALKTLNLANKLQEIDYVYNLNGALKSINQLDLNDSNKDLFGMHIHYYKDDYKRANTPSPVPTIDDGIDQYNGNIKAIEWTTLRDDQQTPGSYYYQYNKNNWLTGASFDTPINEGDTSVIPTAIRNTPQTTTEDIEVSQVVTLGRGFSITASNTLKFSAKIVEGAVGVNTSGAYNVSNITYDANGNIQSLDRNRDMYNGSTEMDKLRYDYKNGKPNQLKRVADDARVNTNADDIKDQIIDENYIYNDIGQLIEDWENVTEIEKNNYINNGVIPSSIIKYEYSVSGLVTVVSKNNVPLVKFFYNDKNHRVKKESYDIESGNLAYTEHYVRDAAGTTMAIYRDGVASEYTIYGSSRLGVYQAGSGSSLYQLTDHLGNVRAVVGRTSTGQQMALTTATDYYPFGMPMPNRTKKGDYRYAYQGQEVDKETGKEAFQLRLWDNRIGRWLTTDPYGQYSSPYLGMGNNPITMVDPDGGMAGPCNRPGCQQNSVNSLVAEGFKPLSSELGGLSGSDPFLYTSGTQSLEEVLLIGQTRQFKLPDPKGVNFNTGIFGTSRQEVWNGSIWIPTEDFSYVTHQKIAASLLIGPKGVGRTNKGVSLRSGEVVFNTQSKEALKRLGVLPTFVKIKNGVARMDIGFLRKFKPGDMEKVEQALLANGATQIKVGSGISVHPVIVNGLNKRIASGEGFIGFEITSGFKAWITGNRYILTKTLK